MPRDSVIENLHEGHRERVRDEYRKLGLPTEPHKQLELLLFYAQPRSDTNPTAHRLINRFSSLQGVLDAEYHELLSVEGVGKQTATFLSFVGMIAQTYNTAETGTPGIPLDTDERVEAFVRDQIGRKPVECVLAAFLDAKRRLICTRITRDTAGSSARVENSRRVIASLALQYRAAGVLIGHNHPNGTAMPSKGDTAEAERISDALRAVGLVLCDFIIAGGDGETYSLVRSGLLRVRL